MQSSDVLLFYVCVCEGQLVEVDSSIYHVDPGDQSEVIRFGSKGMSPLTVPTLFCV